MSQSDTVSNILERITQETAQVTTKKKIFGMKSKRTSKTPQKKVVLDSSTSPSSTSNSMSPATSPYQTQQSQLPSRSQSMPIENLDNIISPSSSTNLSENTLNRSSSTEISNDDFFSDQWKIISPCIDNIFEQGTGGKFEPAFQAVERLCQSKQYSENINDQLLIKIDSFSKIIVKKLNPPIDFQLVISVLDFIQHSNALLASIFSTFERSFLSPQSTIEQLVFKNINKDIHANQSIVDNICMAVVNKITEQRKEAISSIINQNLTNSQLSNYQQTAMIVNQFDLSKDIIKPLENETVNFYSKLDLKDETPKFYLNQIKLIIEKEEQIINSFAPDIQKVDISATRENVYVKKFINDFPRLIKIIMDSNDTETMMLLASLVTSASDESLTKSYLLSWSNDLKQRCEKIISSDSDNENEEKEQKNKELIPSLIKIHNTMISCREIILKKDVSSIFRVFKTTINEATFKISFLLARYCHELILNNPQSFIKNIEQITNLFRELDLKDTFFNHYEQFLSIRLLNRFSSIESDEKESEAEKAEKYFLSEIDKICGKEYIAPMLEIIKDSESWIDLNSEFLSSLKEKPAEKVEEIQPNQNEEKQEREELTSSHSFPIFFQTFNSTQIQKFEDNNISFTIPSEVQKERDTFSLFYSKKYERKRLKWIPILDQVTAKLNNTTINCSVLYYVIIDSIINGHPLQETKIDEKTIKELVDVLVANKIIICEQKNDNDNVFNCNFLIAPNDEEKFVVLPNPSLLMPKMLKDEKMSELLGMRQKIVEAAIVLHMKKLRVSKKEDLYEYIKDSSTFNVSVELFDKCIDSLIDRLYISTNKNGYIVFTTE